MTVDDVKEAVQSAYDSFKKYRTTTPKQRQDLLQELYRLYQENINDIARLIVWENGKSWNDAMAEAVYAGSFFQWFAGEAMRSYGDVVPCSLPGTRNFTVKQPVGVCALLVPCVIFRFYLSRLTISWNFPAAMSECYTLSLKPYLTHSHP